MTEQEFNKLINKDIYQVLLFKCRAHFPFSFANHLWFVVNKKGTISRWEVLYMKNNDNTYLYKNCFSPYKGINIFNFSKTLFWQGKLLHMISDSGNSMTEKMIDFIENSKKIYPYKNAYSLLGPNSNTYIQWILKYFPDFNFKLPDYIGKDYNK